MIVFASISAILIATGIAAAQCLAYVVAHVTALQKPYVTSRTYAQNLFCALLLYAFAFSTAGYLLVNAIFELDIAFISSVFAAMILPTFSLNRVMSKTKIEKAETVQRIQRKKQRTDRRRYFYT